MWEDRDKVQTELWGHCQGSQYKSANPTTAAIMEETNPDVTLPGIKRFRAPSPFRLTHEEPRAQ